MPSPWWRGVGGNEDALRLHTRFCPPPKGSELVFNHEANLLACLDAIYDAPTQLRRDSGTVAQEKRCRFVEINARNRFDSRVEWQE